MKHLCKKTIALVATAALLAIGTMSFAKTEPVKITGQVSLRPTGTLILYGTSTLHNWEMTAKQVLGSAQFEIANTELTGLDALTCILPVHNLKADKDDL